MEGQIQLHVDVPHELLGTKIPRFILQPIVENAIFHGLYPKNDTGTIILSVRQEAHQLILTVIDDGVGAGKDSDSAKRKHTGVGLNNVRERLCHMYPNGGSSLTMFSRRGVGTNVQIAIPFNRQAG
jgi:two-component system sensor histidine kinase YesM